MCGIGNRTCGICANAGGCLAGMLDDYFALASKKEVLRRLENNEYLPDKEIMVRYVETPDESLQFCLDVCG